MKLLIKWKPVVGYEGLYEVSDYGDIKSLRRWTHNGKSAYGFKGGKGLLKPSKDIGFHSVTIAQWIKNKVKPRYNNSIWTH